MKVLQGCFVRAKDYLIIAIELTVTMGFDWNALTMTGATHFRWTTLDRWTSLGVLVCVIVTVVVAVAHPVDGHTASIRTTKLRRRTGTLMSKTIFSIQVIRHSHSIWKP